MILFLERLELYVSSGLSINKALKLASEGSIGRQRKDIDDIRISVEHGRALSVSLSESAKVNRSVFSLIRYGESTGDLVQALAYGRQLLEREDELYRKCLGALTYPLIIGIFASLLTFGLVRGVMPQIVPMLKSFHVSLPWLTRLVIWISDALISSGLYILLAFTLIAIISRLVYSRFESAQRAVHMAIHMMPIFGRLIFEYHLSVLLHSAGALIHSGLPVERVFSEAVRSIPFFPLRELVGTKSVQISNGQSVGYMFASEAVPSFVPPLLLAGEATGTLGISLGRSASIIDRDIEHMLKKLTALVEPLLMALMGLVVGAIALSIMMPIYDVSRALQR